MPEYGIRERRSQCPFQLEMLDDHGGVIATGSAFIFRCDDKNYLITNWHNISGKDFLTKEPLSERSGSLPTRLRAKFISETNRRTPDGAVLLGVKDTPLAIYGDDYEPLWFEHPNFGSNCDVIALPLERLPPMSPKFHRAANEVSQMRIPVIPGATVFIIGYPFGISVGIGLPVWKSGYIASEPHFPVTLDTSRPVTIPAFFIDSQTRQGMSGSPVFAQYVGNWNSSDPYSWDADDPHFLARPDVMIGSRGMEFVGCYGARVPGKGEDAALGLCWSKEAIEEICRGGKRGKHPHVAPA